MGRGASWILLVITGGAGAVGVSSIANGLEAVAGIVGLMRVTEEPRNVSLGIDVLRDASHVIPSVTGLGFAALTVQATTISPADAT